jgi:hypothetical protein
MLLVLRQINTILKDNGILVRDLRVGILDSGDLAVLGIMVLAYV